MAIEIKKKDLIAIIQKTKSFSHPVVELEQYCIDAVSAVDIIYLAGFEHNDIEDRVIIDLGAGTGRLSIASAFFKASFVIGVEIDWNAIQVFLENINNLDLREVIYPVCADIRYIPLNLKNLSQKMKVTTIMNPPFGVQKRKSDSPFLMSAFSFSDVIYSIHLTGEKNLKFLTNLIEKHNWQVDNVISMNLVLERSFHFHTKKLKKIDVSVYRLIK